MTTDDEECPTVIQGRHTVVHGTPRLKITFLVGDNRNAIGARCDWGFYGKR